MKVVRATADASGVYACVQAGGMGRGSIVHIDPGGSVDALVDAPDVGALATDDASVYWVGADGLHATSKKSPAARALASRSFGADARDAWSAPTLALDADYIYFAGGGNVERVAKRGGAAETIESGRPGAAVVAVDGANVYWLLGTSTRDLYATPKAGGAAKRVARGLANLIAVAVDDTDVYWIADTHSAHRGSLQSVAKRGGEATTLVDDVPTFYAATLVAAGQDLYWLDYPGGLQAPMRVRTVPKHGGTPDTLATPFPTANELFVDDARVYWAEQGVFAVTRPH